MHTHLLAAALVGMVASPALAADFDIVSDPNPARFGDWTGFQIGAQYGYGWAEDTFPDQGEGDFYGAFASYNHQFGNVVVGAEVEWMQLDNVYDLIPATLESVIVLGGRLGWSFGRVLPYAEVGASYADTDLFGNDWGVAFGAGVDVMVTDNIIVGAKYLRHEYTDFNGTGIDASLDSLAVRASFKF